METKLDFWTRRLFRRVSLSQILLMVIWDKSNYPIESLADQKLGGKCSPSENHTPPLKRLPYLQFAFIIITGFAVVTIGVRVLSKPMVAPVDLFSGYMDIFPGQSVSAVKARGFLCRSAYNFDRDPMEEVCAFTPAADIVSNIYVTASKDVIRQITFRMRENALTVGDLLLLMDVHHFHTYAHNIFFPFGKNFVAVWVDSLGNPSPFHLVWSVSFIDTSVPMGSH